MTQGGCQLRKLCLGVSKGTAQLQHLLLLCTAASASSSGGGGGVINKDIYHIYHNHISYI